MLLNFFGKLAIKIFFANYFPVQPEEMLAKEILFCCAVCTLKCTSRKASVEMNFRMEWMGIYQLHQSHDYQISVCRHQGAEVFLFPLLAGYEPNSVDDSTYHPGK